MRRYVMNVSDKKLLIRKLEELLGIKAKYTRVPRCAYQVDFYFVEKNGELTVETDEAETEIERVLLEEGFIGDQIVQVPRRQQRIHFVQGSRSESGDEIVLTMPEQRGFETVTETWEPDEPETEEDEGMDFELPDFSIPTLQTRERIEQEEEVLDREEEMVIPSETPSENVIEEIEDLQEEPPVSVREEVHVEQEEEIQEDSEYPMDASFGFPLSKHSGSSIINLVNIIYSRGALLSKATKGSFYCSKDLAEKLSLESGLYRIEQPLEIIKAFLKEDSDCLQGISFTEDQVMIDGFKKVPDAEHVNSFMVLAEKINKMSIQQNRVQARIVDDSNERYALRTWLNRLGMKGNEYKTVRKHLMEHLSGHTAFRTKEDEEKAKRKMVHRKEQEQV